MIDSAKIDQDIYNTAIKQGFNPIAAKLIVAQARFESADYTSAVFKANNNTSGIKYIGASQINAQRGTPAPSNERRCNLQCNGDFYAKFDTVPAGMKAKLIRINVIEFVEKNKVNLAVVGAIIIGITAYVFYLKKKKVI